MADKQNTRREPGQDVGTPQTRDAQQMTDKTRDGQWDGFHSRPRPIDDPSTAPESGDSSNRERP